MKKIVTSRKNRVCKARECKHLLSIYNAQDICYVHQREERKSPTSASASKS